VTETSERATSWDGFSINTRFSVAEVLGTTLVAVYNLTAQYSHELNQCPDSCQWLVAREGLTSLLFISFTKWKNTYKVMKCIIDLPFKVRTTIIL
jgi:hypothetical protein